MKKVKPKYNLAQVEKIKKYSGFKFIGEKYKDGERVLNYVRPLIKHAHYPRFHLMVRDKKDHYTLHLHIDFFRHDGSVQGTKMVHRELQRIRQLL